MNMQAPLSKQLKLIAIGNSTGFVLPKEMLAKLGVQRGDEVMLVETPDGFELRRDDADFEAQMTATRAVMERRRAALRELAK